MSGKQSVGGDTWQDLDDAPELMDAFFEQAAVQDGARVIRRRRPKAALTKAQVKLRLDADVLAGLRATGPGWQSRANSAIKEWLAAGQRHRS